MSHTQTHTRASSTTSLGCRYLPTRVWCSVVCHHHCRVNLSYITSITCPSLQHYIQPSSARLRTPPLSSPFLCACWRYSLSVRSVSLQILPPLPWSRRRSTSSWCPHSVTLHWVCFPLYDIRCNTLSLSVVCVSQWAWLAAPLLRIRHQRSLHIHYLNTTLRFIQIIIWILFNYKLNYNVFK